MHPGQITRFSAGGEIVVLFASLPMISSSTLSMPEDAILVLSVTLPTISTTTDPGPPNAEALQADSISVKANMIDFLNTIPLQQISHLS
jgi:hypothetical protein